MISNIFNIVLLAGFSTGALYGVITMARNKELNIIFEVALIAMIAFFISRLFYLVLNFSNGDLNGFSVGVLGQVAAYLFLVLANRTYLPFENNRKIFDFKAALILIFPLICYGYSFTVVRTLGDVVCSVLYLCSTALAMYFSFGNLLAARSDSNYRKLSPFFACVMLITITSTIESIVFSIENPVTLTVVCSILTVIVFIDSVIMLPLLNRGLKKICSTK